MTVRFSIFLLIILIMVAACESLPPEKIIEVEVTRLVIVTATAEQTTGPVPVETEAVNAQSAEETAEVTSTSLAATATPDVFPTPIVGQIFLAQQEFQNATMFWLQPINQIWILQPNEDGDNIWIVRDDSYSDGLPENDPSLTPPSEGLIQPIRGFGMLWRSDEALRNQIGWAVGEELGYTTDYEYHWGGTVDENNVYVPGPGYHLVTTFNGEVYRFDEESRIWEIIEQAASETPVPTATAD
jgi:hypothetical protein